MQSRYCPSTSCHGGWSTEGNTPPGSTVATVGMSTSAPSSKASDRPLAASWWVFEAPLGVTLTLFGCATGVAYLGPKGEYVLSGSDSGDIAPTGATFPITFDHFGRPDTSGNTVQFTFSGESTFRVCLSPLGAIYRGPC